MKPILTITGSDPTGGSGIQADIKTMSELGGYALSVITSITVQTTLGIQEFYDLPAKSVQRQIEGVMNDLQPEVVKIGLIRTIEVLDVVVDALQRYRPHYVIYDAVRLSSRGDALLSDSLVREIRERLLPLCTLVITDFSADSTSPHGLANRYASAVAVYLSKGATVGQAQADARTYINTQIVRSSDLQGRASELYNEFIAAVSEHFCQYSDVHYYANLLNVSSRYLAQVTKRISGKAPKAIIDDYLIREIELQLNTTDRTVQEIAYGCGFSSQAHLTKFFKKNRGESPTAFRKAKKGRG
ncbi:MAG: bifunctional hydroxymethylpyrimidine kinase/phosphomethylpyrimidine kinase [Prevotella sp.]|nr:bifunctional hydroxymethylpyrimidine kinase/phosphomethylpyrimidine kinase [Prevotella sp.]